MSGRSLENWANDPSPPTHNKLNGRDLIQDNINRRHLATVGRGGCLFLSWITQAFLWWLELFFKPQGWFAAILVLIGIGYVIGNPQYLIPALLILGVVIFIVYQVMGGEEAGQAAKALADYAPATREEIESVGAVEIEDPDDLDKLKAHATQIVLLSERNLDGPDHWLTVPDNIVSSFTIGKSIILTRAALDSRFLGAVVAHEIYRLNAEDGIVRLALMRLGIPQSKRHNWEKWRTFWRQQVFDADRFTADCGYANELIEYLEYYKPIQQATPLYDQEEPYIQERISRLKRLGA